MSPCGNRHLSPNFINPGNYVNHFQLSISLEAIIQSVRSEVSQGKGEKCKDGFTWPQLLITVCKEKAWLPVIF